VIAMRAALLIVVASAALSLAQVRIVPPPWVTTSCWVEPRWFGTLRNGPMDYCKAEPSLPPRPDRLPDHQR
jgi:hypothetical protein